MLNFWGAVIGRADDCDDIKAMGRGNVFVLQVMACVIFVYGLLSLVQDISNEITYKKISHDMKIVVLAKDLEKNIDQFMIEFYHMKKVNSYKQIIVVDLEKEDDINKIKTRFYNNEVNVDVLDYKNGKEYIQNLFQNKNISFL